MTSLPGEFENTSGHPHGRDSSTVSGTGTVSSLVSGHSGDNRGGLLCLAFLDVLPVSGASITVIGRSPDQSTIYTTDATAARVEELQFELGEGPHWEAMRTGLPVLVPDVRQSTSPGWPVFGEAVRHTAARAIFAFPLRVGAITIGVVDLYRASAGVLSAAAIAAARGLAGTVAAPALHAAVHSAEDDLRVVMEGIPELRREVHQATGMILAQLGLGTADAFVRLRAYAFASGRSVQYVAHDVVLRRLDFRQLRTGD